MPDAELRVISCESWTAFKAQVLPELFSGDIAARGKFYFRGQGSASYSLMSSLDRWQASPKNERGLTKKDAADKFLKHFRDEASRLTPDNITGMDPEHTLAYAQHYGVPTRLLDWSESPYIAAFFAFAGLADASEKPGFVAIWCLDIKSPIWDEDNGLKLLSLSSPYNERLKNQLGKFTLLQSPFDTVEQHIAQCDRTGTVLRKITLPAMQARPALSDLDFMGINYSTIYPGPEGCALAARLRMVLGH